MHSNQASASQFITEFVMRCIRAMLSRCVFSAIVTIWLFGLVSDPALYAQDKFYNYYDKGIKYMEKKDWLRAVQEFKSAISMEFEDNNNKRTYGTKFIDYYPHRELGIAYFNLGDMALAKQELELSLAYTNSKKAREYLSKVGSGGQTVATNTTVTIVSAPSKEELEKVEIEKKRLKEQQERLDEERRLAEKAKKEERERLAQRQRELEEQKKKNEEQQAKLEAQKKSALASSTVLAGGLLYDASSSPQVGSRLSIAVLPFEAKGGAQGMGDVMAEKLVTQLVNLRRFKVIERSQIEKVIKEQDFQLTDVADVSTVAKVGKIIGADVIVLGSVNIVTGFAKVNARVIDVETAETIVAREKESQTTDLATIEQKVGELAIMIYNDIPLQEGYIISIEQDQSVLIDIGSNRGIRKGTKCVVFREGADIIHPITKISLGKKRTLVAEMVVSQVQDQFSITGVTESKDKIQVGDKVLVK